MGSTTSTPLETVNVCMTITTSSPVRCCATYTHPSGFAHLVTGHNDGRLLVHLVHNGRLLRALEGHTTEVTSCCATPDGRIIASASDVGNTLRLWNLEQGSLSVLTAVQVGIVYAKPDCMCITTDGAMLMTGCADGTMRFYDLGSLPRNILSDVSFEVCEHIGPIHHCCVSADGTASCWCSTEYPIVFDGPKNKKGTYTKPVRRACLDKLWGCSFCMFTLDKAHVVFGRGTKVIVQDTTNYQLEATLDHSKRVTCGCMSPTSNTVIAGGEDGTLCVWTYNTATPVAQQTVAAPFAPPPTTPGARSDISSPATENVDTPCGATKQADTEPMPAVPLIVDAPPCYEAACSPQPKQQLPPSSSSSEGFLIVDSAPKFTFAARMVGHTSGVSCCCVAPDGRTLISGSHDKTIRLWQL
eukprot:TRINITY_DN4841_c0_g1_i1.p1 TRINITY_DN4841_c0_g1~~TRINITY_DN4841_c0_g1_i1.p1  ORF type:complete len:413 (+),score=47.08 TRINITY_DN4841_c0_g1_i1:39-1277(+)